MKSGDPKEVSVRAVMRNANPSGVQLHNRIIVWEAVMKNRLTCVCLMSIVFLALFLSSVQAATILTYKFVPGQVLRYNFRYSTNTSVQSKLSDAEQTPDISTSMIGVLRCETTKVLLNGDAEIKVAFESLNMNIAGVQQTVDLSKMPVITTVLSPSGEVIKTQGLGNMPGAFGACDSCNIGGMIPRSSFPAEPLNVCDKWTQNVPFPMGGKLLVNAQLAAADSKTATIKQSICGDFDISSPLRAQGKISMDGSLLFSTADGDPVSSDAAGVMTMKASRGAKEMCFTTKIHTSMELITPK